MVDRFAGRTIHGAPPHARKTAAHPVLRIEGHVERSLELTPDLLRNFERRRFLDQIHPADLGHWPAKDWSGVPISALIEAAGPKPGSRWIQVNGGPLASVLPIEDAALSLICDRLGEGPIPLENGGPFRLVDARIPYNLAVKWVDSIVVFEDEPDRSVERVAAARQRARNARGIG